MLTRRTNGGRIEPELLRRPPETAGFGDGDEDLEVSELHNRSAPNHHGKLNALSLRITQSRLSQF